MDSLQGHLPIAGSGLWDPNFRRTVVPIGHHDEDGAVGVVLNQPLETTVEEAAPPPPRWSRLVNRCSAAGPCNPKRPWCSPISRIPSAPASSRWTRSASSQRRPMPSRWVGLRRARVFAGYAGWSAGQLEAEMADDAWHAAPAVPGDVFTDDPEGSVVDGRGTPGPGFPSPLHDARGPDAELGGARFGAGADEHPWTPAAPRPGVSAASRPPRSAPAERAAATTRRGGRASPPRPPPPATHRSPGTGTRRGRAERRTGGSSARRRSACPPRTRPGAAGLQVDRQPRGPTRFQPVRNPEHQVDLPGQGEVPAEELRLHRQLRDRRHLAAELAQRRERPWKRVTFRTTSISNSSCSGPCVPASTRRTALPARPAGRPR